MLSSSIHIAFDQLKDNIVDDQNPGDIFSMGEREHLASTSTP